MDSQILEGLFISFMSENARQSIIVIFQTPVGRSIFIHNLLYRILQESLIFFRKHVYLPSAKLLEIKPLGHQSFHRHPQSVHRMILPLHHRQLYIQPHQSVHSHLG